MKNTIIFIFFFVSTKCFCQATVRSYYVHTKGKVFIVQAYKGGAPPTEEMLENLRKPVPLKNEKLFLKKSYYSNKVFILQTDSSGNFDLSIKPGVYNIYLSDEKSAEKKSIDRKDEQKICDEKFKTRSYGTLRVLRKSNYPFEITIEEVVNPCLPLPPAAPSPNQ